jgi:MinD superfamily P-loop ATPase
MRELVILSGKGGTGKTSIAASLAVLSEKPVLADCDVDAADLHIILSPIIRDRHDFKGGRRAIIDGARCIGCGICQAVCNFDAVYQADTIGGAKKYAIDATFCEGCGVCHWSCPEQAIDFPESLSGEWMVSSTRCGPMVHARLGIAADNSGKLVATVRREARRIAEEQGRDIIIVDGPPGIGCPVISSLTGTDSALVVTEPTVSGEHDLERILALIAHFDIPVSVCVNKWDLNPEMTERIEELSRQKGAGIAARVRYDPGVTKAQLTQQAIVETETPSAADVRLLWTSLEI